MMMRVVSIQVMLLDAHFMRKVFDVWRWWHVAEMMCWAIAKRDIKSPNNLRLLLFFLSNKSLHIWKRIFVTFVLFSCQCRQIYEKSLKCGDFFGIILCSCFRWNWYIDLNETDRFFRRINSHSKRMCVFRRKEPYKVAIGPVLSNSKKMLEIVASAESVIQLIIRYWGTTFLTHFINNAAVHYRFIH